MVLKIFFMGIWNFLVFVAKIAWAILKFTRTIYLYVYFGFGAYLIYIKKPLSDEYILIGLWFITMYLMDYIDKKTKK